MATMKKLILLAITAFMISCGDYQGRQEKFAFGGYSDIEIDSCQYIIGYNVLAHKGNCRFCKESRQKELELLIKELKDK